MDIAIIGAGNVGTALAASLVRAGHRVTLASRDPEDAAKAAAASGASIAASNRDAVAGSQVVIPAVSIADIAGLAAELGDVVDGKVVVDVTNRIAFGQAGPEIDTTSSNAEAIAEAFPTVRVVKAFNTLFSSRQNDPLVEGVRLDAFIAGDDADAKATIAELASSIGLDPVDVGPLVRARQLEGLAFLNMAINIEHDGTWQSGWKLVGAPATIAVAV